MTDNAKRTNDPEIVKLELISSGCIEAAEIYEWDEKIYGPIVNKLGLTHTNHKGVDIVTKDKNHLGEISDNKSLSKLLGYYKDETPCDAMRPMFTVCVDVVLDDDWLLFSEEFEHTNGDNTPEVVEKFYKDKVSKWEKLGYVFYVEIRYNPGMYALINNTDYTYFSNHRVDYLNLIEKYWTVDSNFYRMIQKLDYEWFKLKWKSVVSFYNVIVSLIGTTKSLRDDIYLHDLDCCLWNYIENIKKSQYQI